MTDLELLMNGIATQEGFFVPNSLPARNHNPGNLRASPLNRPKDKNGFVIFNNDTEGFLCLAHQLILDMVRGLVTPRQLIESWAPRTGSDGGNNTDLYLSDVHTWTGLDLDKPISFPITNFRLKNNTI